MRRHVLVILAVLFTAGWCALWLSTPITIIPLSTNGPPYNVTARTSLGHVCETPCFLYLYTRDTFTVTFAKPGFRERSIPIRWRPEHGHSPAVLTNIPIEPEAAAN